MLKNIFVLDLFKSLKNLCQKALLCVCRDHFRVFILQYNVLWATVFINWCYITELQSCLIIRAQHIKSHD